MRDRLAEMMTGADLEEVATRVLGVAFVLALLVVVLFALSPVGTGDTYTEFYVLGPDGAAAEYPENVSVGEEATVRVGIRNFESQRMTYTLIVRTNETTFNPRTITLEPGDNWEEPVQFAFDSPGSRRLHLDLYRGETTQDEPYRRLRLLIEVRPS